MSYSEWSDFAYYNTGDIATFGSTAYQALQPNFNKVPTGLAPNWIALGGGGGGGVSSLNGLTGVVALVGAELTSITAGAPTAQDITIKSQLTTYFKDVSLPPLNLNAGNDTTGIDYTPPFFAYGKHYLVSWTTLFQGAVGMTGSVKWGLSQNASPFALPLNNQESSQVFDTQFAITAANAGGIIQSVSVVYFTEADDGGAPPTPFPPNITFWFEGTALSSALTCAIREASIVALD